MTAIRLKTALFGCFLIVAVLPASLLGVWMHERAMQQELDSVQEKHLLMAQNMTAALDRYASDVVAATQSSLHILRANGDAAALMPLLTSLHFNHLCIVDATNKPLAVAMGDNGPPRGASPEQLLILRGMATEKISFSPVMLHADGEPGIWVMQQLPDGQLAIGLLATDYFVKLQKAIAFGRKGHAAIVDSTGQVIAHPREAWRLEAKNLAKVSAVQAMMAGQTGVTQFFSPAVKQDMVAGFAAVPGPGWGVMVPQPLIELTERADSLRLLIWVVAGISFLLAGCIAWALSGWITRPVQTLAAAADHLAENGEMLPAPRERRLPRELGSLRHSFERMATYMGESHEYLIRQAQQDSLTGLYNRSYLHRVLESRLHESREPLALLYVDLDRFKYVNDTLGHRFGDQLLQRMAKRMKKIAGSHPLARLGGDEFVLLLERGSSVERAQEVAKQLLHCVVEPFRIDGHEAQVDASIGIAFAPSDGDTGERLLQAADLAMYEAKKSKGGLRYHFYNENLLQALKARQELEQQLRRALTHGGLDLAYQPRVDMQNGHTLSVEALLRWPEVLGNSNTDIPMVIDVAETSGLITQLGEWVLERAFSDLRTLNTAQGQPLSVSVNLSALQFSLPNLAQLVLQRLTKGNFAPERLEIEITETTAMADFKQARVILDELARIGVTASIDDFGTGHSSLAYLKRLPVSHLKLDQSFVFGIGMDSDDEAIVRTVVQLGHTLGLPVIAEGVENATQWQFLAETGCAQVQGYHVARPMPVQQLAHWLRVQQSVAAEAVA